MFVLILLALVALVIIYAVFFLLFKLVWVLLKKESNKWPLIWAGICTVVLSVFLGGITAWGVYKVYSPFKGMIARFAENPNPIYGERVYTDPVYRFDLNVKNGMDFSEWVEFDDVNAKLGLDMNPFKEGYSAKENDLEKEGFFGAILLRQEEADEGHPLQILRDTLATLTHRRHNQVEILTTEDFMVDGHPAMFVTALLQTDGGDPFFLAISAISDSYQQVFYVISFSINTPEASSDAIELARSLRLENGSPLPGNPQPQALPNAQ